MKIDQKALNKRIMEIATCKAENKIEQVKYEMIRYFGKELGMEVFNKIGIYKTTDSKSIYTKLLNNCLKEASFNVKKDIDSIISGITKE